MRHGFQIQVVILSNLRPFFRLMRIFYPDLEIKEVTIAEIGVLDSGSLLAWQKWFGNKATIIGIDANPDVKKFEKDNIKIEIGNQADPVFWEGFFARYPDVDIVIDDGGHQYFQQAITLFSILNYSQKQTLILFEVFIQVFFLILLTLI